MSGITLTTAQQILDKLLAAQLAGAAGGIGSVSIAGRSVTYRSAQELTDLIDYWQTMVTRLQRAASGQSRVGMKLASFRRC